jgi:hypothetical protein
MKVYFSHGKESGPWGTKIKRLAAIAEDLGCAVDSVDYRDLTDPDLRVERLLEVLANESNEFVLAGSSMGGYVSLVVSAEVDAEAVFQRRHRKYPGHVLELRGDALLAEFERLSFFAQAIMVRKRTPVPIFLVFTRPVPTSDS